MVAKQIHLTQMIQNRLETDIVVAGSGEGVRVNMSDEKQNSIIKSLVCFY